MKQRLIFLAVAVAVATMLSTTQAFAAKFQIQSKMTSAAAQKLSSVAARIVGNETAFGDAGIVAAYHFTRKPTEVDLNTVKQLNFAKAGQNSDDDGAAEAQDWTAERLANHLLDFTSQVDPEFEAAFESARRNLASALKAVRANNGLKIYVTNHADEDGSWQVLNVLDLRNQQILLVKIGYYGT